MTVLSIKVFLRNIFRLKLLRILQSNVNHNLPQDDITA